MHFKTVYYELPSDFVLLNFKYLTLH